ncbi:MAG TPA: hypothetical protein VM658_15955 [bacterium]|nr:hypothetical protein [bacterium]
MEKTMERKTERHKVIKMRSRRRTASAVFFYDDYGTGKPIGNAGALFMIENPDGLTHDRFMKEIVPAIWERVASFHKASTGREYTPDLDREEQDWQTFLLTQARMDGRKLYSQKEVQAIMQMNSPGAVADALRRVKAKGEAGMLPLEQRKNINKPGATIELFLREENGKKHLLSMGVLSMMELKESPLEPLDPLAPYDHGSKRRKARRKKSPA